MRERRERVVTRAMRLHMFLGAAVGLALALVTFDAGYLTGTGVRWQHPSPDLVLYLSPIHYYWNDGRPQEWAKVTSTVPGALQTHAYRNVTTGVVVELKGILP